MKQAVKLLSVMVLLLIVAGLSAQNTLTVSGLNETEFIYRTAADSLNAYFRDSFGFNLGYRNLSFGMKFIAELPKYSVNQDELIEASDYALVENDVAAFQFGYVVTDLNGDGLVEATDYSRIENNMPMFLFAAHP